MFLFDKIFLNKNDVGTQTLDMTRLMNREQIIFESTLIRNMICGKRVLITGGAGSIGSELCRQVLSFDPSSVVIVDRCENYIHDLIVSLGEISERVYYSCASVSDLSAMTAVFYHHNPHLVFHAAAHKHVPLMENNVSEAVVNNYLGAKIVADLSEIHEVEKFVLLSTDKVVNPSSVMGMTKKLAERYIRWMDKKYSARFLAVRFGNVLGSRGSVVPLFWDQIRKGGPVTITHPEMERYFMLSEEAAQLILQSAAMENKYKVFLLEMGRPIKILDLAKRMIRLAGYEPYRDVDIKIIGLRPGEKLIEELVEARETLISIEDEKINFIQSDENSFTDWRKWVTELDTLLIDRDQAKVKEWLMALTCENSLESFPTAFG